MFEFKFRISGLILCLQGELTEHGIFNANSIFLPLTAPQRPIPTNSIKSSILIFNGFPIEPGNEFKIQLLIQYLTDNRFKGHIIFSNLLNIKNCSKKTVIESLKKLDGLLLYLSNACGKIHIIPGINDVSNLSLPIIPINRNVFPKNRDNENLIFHMNPACINIEGVNFYIMSDNSINDLKQNFDIDYCSIEIMENLLKFRQILPSAPSTIPSRPIISSKSPFILRENPHYFILLSNEDELIEKKFESNSFSGQNIVIPNFFSSSKALLFNEGKVTPLLFR
jgi:hypothetical protein